MRFQLSRLINSWVDLFCVVVFCSWVDFFFSSFSPSLHSRPQTLTCKTDLYIFSRELVTYLNKILLESEHFNCLFLDAFH